MVDVGVTQRFLWREYEHALQAALSPDCRQDCHACGILAAYGHERGDCAWGCPE